MACQTTKSRCPKEESTTMEREERCMLLNPTFKLGGSDMSGSPEESRLVSFSDAYGYLNTRLPQLTRTRTELSYQGVSGPS